ncbi:MAG: class I SAM-dependent methyltransferase [Thioalkalivibrio sp.]|nr:class I SAM-dependent methyltransferase [Thioalkalivibrio sp.]
MSNAANPLGQHYARLAHSYNEDWAYSEEFLQWMSGEFARRLGSLPGGTLLDIGAGTGLYSARVGALVQASRVVAVDPSREMLSQMPDDAAIEPIEASAESLPVLWAAMSREPAAAIMIKEAVHHLPDLRATLGGLARLLGPKGCMVVAMLPESIGYPLFDAALRLFERIQPSSSAVREALEDAGLQCSVSTAGFRLRLPRQKYHEMVANRYMSLLANFDDDELAAGLREMQRKHVGRDVLEFTDEFVFVSAYQVG